MWEDAKAIVDNVWVQSAAAARGAIEWVQRMADTSGQQPFVVAIALAVLAYSRGGTELVQEGLGGGVDMLQKFALLFHRP